MADRVVESKYESMISALNKFATNVTTKSSDMQSLANICRNALGEGDEGAEQIHKKISECITKYAKAAAEAKSIAQKMQTELDNQRKERDVWSSDSAD